MNRAHYDWLLKLSALQKFKPSLNARVAVTTRFISIIIARTSSVELF